MNSRSSKSRLWAFQPTEENKSLMSKAIHREMRMAKKHGLVLKERGIKTRLLNEAIRLTFASLAGKRAL